jgi:hypothetical protein
MSNVKRTAPPQGRPLRAIVLGVNGHSRAVASVGSPGRAGIEVIGLKAVGETCGVGARNLTPAHRPNSRA